MGQEVTLLGKTSVGHMGGSRSSWEIQSRETGSSSETLVLQILIKIKLS